MGGFFQQDRALLPNGETVRETPRESLGDGDDRGFDVRVEEHVPGHHPFPTVFPLPSRNGCAGHDEAYCENGSVASLHLTESIVTDSFRTDLPAGLQEGDGRD